LRGARGRVGEGVSDIMDAPKFQFFTLAAFAQEDWNSA